MAGSSISEMERAQGVATHRPRLLAGEQSLIPVSVLTGFLGSGKTTLLNHLVQSPAMSRALVIINEFGAVSLDHDLIARSNEDLVVEMMGGCLCCTIRGDLLVTLRDAPWRFARDGLCWFDRVVIETTGLADPAPILHTLMTDLHLQTLYRLDGVIATVDAVTGMATLDQQEEAVKQAAVADRILLTKTDLASEDERSNIEARLRALNPATPILAAVNGDIDAAFLFDAGLYNPATKNNDVQRWLAAEAYEDSHHHHGHAHHHHDVNRHGDAISATCLTFDEPLEPEAFERWPSDDRRTRLVFITRGMSADDLRGTLALMTAGLAQYGLEGLVSDMPASGLLTGTTMSV